MKKIISILSIVFLLSLMFVPLVSASYVCPAAGWQDTPSTLLRLTALSDSTTSAYSGVGTAFTANATCYLYNATFNLMKEGVPTGSIVAQLYAATGTVGTNAVPTGLPLDASVTLDVSTLYGSYLPTTFQFSGTVEMTNATDYVILLKVLDVDGGWISASKDVCVGEASSSTATRNGVHYHSSSWAATPYDSAMPLFIINGDTTEYAGATPTPTPTDAPTTSTGDADIENLTAIILPWLVPLLVCLIPALLGYKFVGELGFFIGLNVGCILAYVTLAGTAYAFPLWGIILVGVMDVAVVLMRR